MDNPENSHKSLESNILHSGDELFRRELNAASLESLIIACFYGKESRRWRVLEIKERLKSLGRLVQESSIIPALADIADKLENDRHHPFRLVEAGTEWLLVPKSAVFRALSSPRTLDPEKPLSETAKAVLLVILAYRKRGGVSKTKIERIIAVDAERAIEELQRFDLIRRDISLGYGSWLPTGQVLLALGFSQFSEIPGLSELEQFIDFAAESRNHEKLVAASEKAVIREVRTRRRRVERRSSVLG